MIEISLFVSSFICVILFLISVLFNKVIPFPILHLFGVTFGNVYISIYGLAYQTYFWFNYFGILG